MSNLARRGWQGAALTIDHTWYGFIDTPNFLWEEFGFRRDVSFPAFTNFSLNLDQENDLSYYNIGLEWSCPWHDFAGDIIDTQERYEIVLRLYDPGWPGYESLPDVGEVDITPRRLQEFVVSPGVVYTWENIQLPGDTVIQSGTITQDSYGLVTIAGVTVTKAGNRLRVVNPTPVSEIDANRPLLLSLGQNRPNPFSSATTIEYELAADTFVELSVYNLAGERIRTLTTGLDQAGRHRLAWNGTNDHGVSLSSGLYSYTITLETGHTETRHMILLR
jgi:hypothetical protein